MLELLFDIRPETGQVRVTTSLAYMMNRKGCNVHYTDTSDSVFTSSLLKKGIGRVLYPDDLRWFTPDLALLDLLLKERLTIYKQNGIDCQFITVEKENQGVNHGVTVLYLPPSPFKPLSKGAREADFIEKLEDIKEGYSRSIIIGLLEKEDSNPSDVEQIYKAIKMYSIDHPEHQFIVLTNQGAVEEELFALPENIAIYRPQHLQTLLPLCDLALVTDERNIQTECTLAHIPAVMFLPCEIRKMTPQKLGRHIAATLNHRNYFIEQQKQLCHFYEQENQRLDEVADRLIEYMKRKKNRENEKISIL